MIVDLNHEWHFLLQCWGKLGEEPWRLELSPKIMRRELPIQELWWHPFRMSAALPGMSDINFICDEDLSLTMSRLTSRAPALR